MAKKKNELSLGDALENYLQNTGMKEKVLVQRVISDWETLMGKPVAEHTNKIWFTKGILYVEMNHPAWKQEMTMSQTKIVEVVNRHLGAELVKEVKVV